MLCSSLHFFPAKPCVHIFSPMRTTGSAHLILLGLLTIIISVKEQPMMLRVTATRNFRTLQFLSLVSLVLYSFSRHHCSDW